VEGIVGQYQMLEHMCETGGQDSMRFLQDREASRSALPVSPPDLEVTPPSTSCCGPIRPRGAPLVFPSQSESSIPAASFEQILRPFNRDPSILKLPWIQVHVMLLILHHTCSLFRADLVGGTVTPERATFQKRSIELHCCVRSSVPLFQPLQRIQKKKYAHTYTRTYN